MHLYEVDIVKIEKEKAMQRYRRFRKIIKIVRALEFCFAVVLFSWLISRSSSYFAAVFNFSGNFLRRFSTLLLNHHFIFLLGNGIIITLFVKFGQFPCDKQIIGIADDDDEDLIGQVVSEIPQREAVFDEKQVLTEVTESDPVERRAPEVKRCRRSRSHVFDREKTEKIRLQRSETEPRRKLEDSDSETVSIEKTFDEDDLSNEEFNRKVEAFIARQQKFLREESLSVVFA